MAAAGSTGRDRRTRAALRILAIIGVWFAVCFASQARADPARVPRALEYSAPEECSDASAFSAQIARRTAIWARAQPELRVRVRIERAESRLRGVLTLEDAGGATVREVSSERCGDVVQALALIVAILVDPEADTRPLPELHGAASVPPPAATGPRPARARATPRMGWGVSAGTQLSVAFGVAESALIGQRWFAALAREGAGGPTVALRLAVGHDGTGTIEHGDGASSALSRNLVRLDGCGAALSEPEFVLSICGFGEGGRIDAVGVHPVRSEARALGWFAFGALVRAALTYERVLGLEAELGAGFPVTRYRFQFEGESLYETAPIAPGAGAGLFVHFP